jgi:hypothetical protein
MLKKLIIFIVVAGLGYVGYLVWTEQLSPKERATIKQKLDDAGNQIKKGASNLAKKTAKVVKKELADDDKKTDDAQKKEAQPEKPSPAPGD